MSTLRAMSLSFTARTDRFSPLQLLVAALLPVIFFFAAIIYFSHDFFQYACEWRGDYPLISLEVTRALRFESYLGSYSRFRFNHPGPITFYAYALGTVIFRIISSEEGRYFFTQLVLNALFAFGALSAIYRLTSSIAISWGAFSLLIFVSMGVDQGIIYGIWNPQITVFPLFCLLCSSVAVASASWAFLPLSSLAFVFTTQNHIGTVGVSSVILAFSITLGLRHGGEEKDIGISLLVSILILLIAYSLPLVEALRTPGGGNLGAILRFFVTHSAKNSIDKPLVVVTELLVPFGSVALKSLTLIIITSLPFLGWKDYSRELKAALIMSLAASASGLVSAFEVRGKLYPYLFLFLVSIFAFQLLCLLWAMRENFLTAWKGGVWVVVSALSAAVFLFIPPRFASGKPACDDSRTQILNAISPSANTLYHLTLLSRKEWDTLGLVAEEIYRAGDNFCVSRRWSFLFGSSTLCSRLEGKFSKHQEIQIGALSVEFPEIAGARDLILDGRKIRVLPPQEPS